MTRSAFFLILFMVVHAIGNLHFFLGPDDFNGACISYKRKNILESIFGFALPSFKYSTADSKSQKK